MLLALDLRMLQLRRWLAFPLMAFAGALVFAWMCDAVGDHDGITVVDGPVSLWFAVHRTVVEGRMGLLLAHATSPVVLVAATGLAVLTLRRRGYRLESTMLAAATVIAYVAGAVAKLAEHRARPLAPVNLAPEGEPSFPSGHVLVIATVAMVCVGLAWASLTKVQRVLAASAASVATVLVAVDRLVVGAHWVTDVIGSLALAGVIAACVLGAHALLHRGD